MTRQEALDRIELAIYDYLSLTASYVPGLLRVNWSQRLTLRLVEASEDIVRDWNPVQFDVAMEEQS